MYTQYFQEAIDLKIELMSNKDFNTKLTQIIFLLKKAFSNGNKLLTAGNGGSAADAQHFSAEIVGRYKKERKGYPAIALTTDSSILTAWSNDYNFDTVFSRQIEALGQPDDIFFGLSTSGMSQNIINAINVAKQKNIFTICLLGKNGGELKNHCDLSIIVPSNNTPRIQEIHTMIIHIICEEIENVFEK